MSLKDSLLLELKEPLPGLDYQLRMAPDGRPVGNEGEINRDAAVALLIRKTGPGYEFLLIKRPEYDGVHSGQVSFPGGKNEADDPSLIHTAIRETKEEIGIRMDRSELLGRLTPLVIPVSGFKVQPYVFYQESALKTLIDPAEVARVIHAPLMSLIKENAIKKVEINVRGYALLTPYYDIDNEIVWGATAMILSEFAEILRRIMVKNPGLKL